MADLQHGWFVALISNAIIIQDIILFRNGKYSLVSTELKGLTLISTILPLIRHSLYILKYSLLAFYVSPRNEKGHIHYTPSMPGQNKVVLSLHEAAAKARPKATEKFVPSSRWASVSSLFRYWIKKDTQGPQEGTKGFDARST